MEMLHIKCGISIFIIFSKFFAKPVIYDSTLFFLLW